MDYKKGECIGQGLCDFYRPAPENGKDYWPKIMRSRSYYAAKDNYFEANGYDSPIRLNQVSGSDKKEKSPKPAKPAVAAVKAPKFKASKSADRAIDFHTEHLNDATTLEELLKYLDGKVIAWISYEESQMAAGVKYKPKCLMQYKDHYLPVSSIITQNSVERALLSGVCAIASRIVKPCQVYVVTDRPLLDGLEASVSMKDGDLLYVAAGIFEKAECSVAQVRIDGATELIRGQIESHLD